MSVAFSDSRGRIQILPPLLAQKIAAGEVIERPQSVVRELLDNALDSGADAIDVHLSDGGNTLIVVQDNGCGMDRENLDLCWLPHATSKIHEESDLCSIRTMGFRGEALSSIATVARLSIYSFGTGGGGFLEVHGGIKQGLDPWAGRPGSRIEVANLFFNLPARLQFLKRAGSEFLLCKTTFIEKALPQAGIAFRLFNDGKLAAFFPVTKGEESLKDRFFEVYRTQIEHKSFLQQISAHHPEANVTMVLGRPELYQHDRRLMQVFINLRRINEFSLIQAIEAGYSGFLPGGRFPVAAIFLEIEPSKVDVNIHPAKREVKLLDNRRLHAIVVRMIQDFLRIDHHRRPVSEPVQARGEPFLGNFENHTMVSGRESIPVSPNRVIGHHSTINYDLLKRFALPSAVAEPTNTALPETPLADNPASPSKIRYIGQIFGVFLLAQHGERLIMLDFHAAHERILYDRYCCQTASQNLLVPICLSPVDPDLGFDPLMACQESLSQRGIIIRQ